MKGLIPLTVPDEFKLAPFGGLFTDPTTLSQFLRINYICIPKLLLLTGELLLFTVPVPELFKKGDLFTVPPNFGLLFPWLEGGLFTVPVRSLTVPPVGLGTSAIN